MVKSILRETCIMLLLCIPSNKTIPSKMEAYVTPENVQKEIEAQIVETEKEKVTYTITGADLTLYEQTNSFVSGKPDPFSVSTSTNNVEEEGGNGSTNSETSGGTSGEGSSSGVTDPNSTGTFFNDMGLK